MKKALSFDVLKRLFAIVLCAAISVAYLPLLGQGETAYAQSSRWQENVKTIKFVPVGELPRVVYKALHSQPDDLYDDEGDVIGSYDYYRVPFRDGDTVIATLVNGTKKTIVYDGNIYEWKDEKGTILTEEVPGFTETNEEWQYINHWQIGGTYNAYVTFGSYYDDEEESEKYPLSNPIRVTVKNSPIKTFEFTPSQEREGETLEEADIVMAEDYYDDKYIYHHWFCNGDKITITWEDGDTAVEYTFDEDEYRFFDSEGNDLEALFQNDEVYIRGPEYVSDEPFSLNGASSGTITFTVSYMDHSDTFDVNVETSNAADLELAKIRSAARNELREMSRNLDWDAYRSAQQEELDRAFDKGISAIFEAKNAKEIYNALAAAKKAIKAIKTDAQLTAEEKDWNGTLSGAVPAAKGVKAKAAKKKVKVSWKKANKKNLKKFDKVEIQVCPDKKFNRANTKRVEVKKSKKSTTVKGLTKGKTYYVRVRNVKGSGQKKLVSKWSGVKKAKIK